MISLGCHNKWKLESGLDEIIAKTVEKLPSINSNIFTTKPREMVFVSIYILGIKHILQLVVSRLHKLFNLHNLVLFEQWDGWGGGLEIEANFFKY